MPRAPRPAGIERVTLASKLIDTLYRDYFNAIAKHHALPEADVQRLGVLANRAANAAVRQPDVPAPLTSAARSTFPDITQPWVYAERRVVALALYRGDAHIAAWREDRRRGRGILWSQNRYQDQRRNRTELAVLDDPVRF